MHSKTMAPSARCGRFSQSSQNTESIVPSIRSATKTASLISTEAIAPADSALDVHLVTPFDSIDRILPPPLPGDVPNPHLARDYSVAVFEDWRDLASHVQDWDTLLDSALEPNVFFSSSAVLSAMRHLPLPGKPRFLLVQSTERGRPKAPPTLCGFFPFFLHQTFRGLPVRNLRLLKHDYCFLQAPLLRADSARPVLDAVFDWIGQSGVSLVELGCQPSDGLYAELLATVFHERGGDAMSLDSHARAMIQCGSDARQYLRESISGGKIKELRRVERRLAEQGELRYECVGSSNDWQTSMDEFLALEAAGWKGREKTSLNSREHDRLFFSDLVAEFARRGRLRLSALRLNGRAIAMKCNLLSPPGSFAFKIAYDEAFQRFSPGQLLEVDNIRRLHAEADVHWMDSCADPGHPMIEHLWKERRLIQSWIYPIGRWGRFLAAALPLCQWAKRAVVREKNTMKIASKSRTDTEQTKETES